jgi:hypothetical protein
VETIGPEMIGASAQIPLRNPRADQASRSLDVSGVGCRPVCGAAPAVQRT